MKTVITAEEATARLEQLCSRSEQCSSEVMQKMRRWQLPAAQAQKVLDHLIAHRFVDDARYAEAFVRDKYRFARWGRVKIRTSLIAKRISSDDIHAAMKSVDLREYALIAFDVVAAKLRQLPADLSRYELRQRLLRFAVGRGYELSLAIKILESNRLWQAD